MFWRILQTAGCVVKPILSSEFNFYGEVDLVDIHNPHKASSSGSWFTSVTSQSFLSWRPCLPRELLKLPFNCWIYSSSSVHQLSFRVTTAQNSHSSHHRTQRVVAADHHGSWQAQTSPKPGFCWKSKQWHQRHSGRLDEWQQHLGQDNRTQNYSVIDELRSSCWHKQNPYKAIFGEDSNVGLTSSSLSPEILERLQSDNDFLALYQASHPALLNPHLFTTMSHLQPPMNHCHLHLLPPASLLLAPLVDHLNNPPPLNFTPLDKRFQDITNQQKKTCESQLSHAEKMVKRSCIDLQAGGAVNNVAVPILMVDRSRGHPRINKELLLIGMNTTCIELQWKLGF